MKTGLHILLFACIPYIATTQISRVESLLSEDTLFVKKLDVPAGNKVMYLSSPYAKAPFTDIRFSDSALASVQKIQLVYTTYRLSPEFNQEALNRERLKYLYKKAPGLFSRKEIQWELVAQTGCTSQENGKDFFHGFVVISSAGTATTEESASAGTQGDSIVREKEIAFTDSIITKMLEKDSILYFTKSKWDKRVGFVPDSNYAVYASGVRKKSDLDGQDTTIFHLLNKNATQWSRILLVVDVTGSMAPYTIQVLAWLKKQVEGARVGKIVFFNDGDKKSNALKKPGSTGGIYIADPGNFEKITETMQTAMQNGDGGDIPENNIEAILAGMEACPDCEDIVMIADNKARIKDIELMTGVKKPVHILLCGVYKNFEKTYEDLAVATGGKIWIK